MLAHSAFPLTKDIYIYLAYALLLLLLNQKKEKRHCS